MNRLALHTCCGPCLIEPLRILQEEFDDITSIYYNPNIRPADEYERRRDTCFEYAHSQGLSPVELAYEPRDWEEATRDASDEAGRCMRCYEVRFKRVIAWANEQGHTHFATTLTVSPYQNQESIARLARELCAEFGLQYAGRDFSAHYREATRISRERGMYRQKYCGCNPRH